MKIMELTEETRKSMGKGVLLVVSLDCFLKYTSRCPKNVWCPDSLLPWDCVKQLVVLMASSAIFLSLSAVCSMHPSQKCLFLQLVPLSDHPSQHHLTLDIYFRLLLWFYPNSLADDSILSLISRHSSLWVIALPWA